MDKFLSAYACIKNKENALSDLIATACNICDGVFADFFLKFMFGDDLDTSDFVEMQREITAISGAKRVDLLTKLGKKIYAIENKVWDRSDHFAKYSKVKEWDDVAFIAAYDVSNLKYKHKHTWGDLYKAIISKLNSLDGNCRELFEAMTKYIKEVCSIMEERQFYPYKTRDIGYVMEVLKKVLGEMGYTVANNKKSCTVYCSGVHFDVTVKRTHKRFWVGMYYDDQYGFWISREDEKEYTHDREYSNVYKDEPNWLYLKECYLKQLDSDDAQYTKKYEILKCFIREAVAAA